MSTLYPPQLSHYHLAATIQPLRNDDVICIRGLIFLKTSSHWSQHRIGVHCESIACVGETEKHQKLRLETKNLEDFSVSSAVCTVLLLFFKYQQTWTF